MRMIIIKPKDIKNKKKALGFLAGRFSFKSWAKGGIMVPEQALSALAVEGIHFSVEGPATYEQIISTFRNAAASAV